MTRWAETASTIEKNMETPSETTLFLVHNGGEYSDYSVLALFTDKTLAEEFAKAADGEVEEWPANVPQTKWMAATANLWATKKEGRWEVKITTSSAKPFIAPKEVTCVMGCNSKWGERDPATGQYTCAQAHSVAQSEEEARKMCADAFWHKVGELDR